jgi:SAM-dependent methyltransferase
MYFPVDVCEIVSRKRPPLIPPRGMRFNNTRTYISLGKHGLDSLIRHCQLRPDHRVLDVGCGTGSMALPLIDYLAGGTYQGFDIVPSWITWCQEHITRRNPRFRFDFIDVYSRHYNSTGKLTSETLKFPYEAESWVMKHGAKGFITTCLLNAESKKAIANGHTALPFPHTLGECRVMDKFFPETGIAIPENEILAWFSEAGLRVTTTMYGSWGATKSA